jgi:hypothetical protein
MCPPGVAQRRFFIRRFPQIHADFFGIILSGYDGKPTLRHYTTPRMRRLVLSAKGAKMF